LCNGGAWIALWNPKWQVADLFLPSELASKLEQYREFVPSMDEKLFGMTQEAAAKRRDVVDVWAKSERSVFDSISRGLTGLRPNNFHYGALIHAWINAGDIDRAEALLRNMVDDYKQGNKAAAPDTKAFSEVT
jgi:pentatricopeptide repeat protein